jgi:hypothetical protein
VSGADSCTNRRRHAQEARIHAAGDACGSRGDVRDRRTIGCPSHGRRSSIASYAGPIQAETALIQAETGPIQAETLVEAMASMAGSHGVYGRKPWRLWPEAMASMAGSHGVDGRKPWRLWPQAMASMAGSHGVYGRKPWRTWLEAMAYVAGSHSVCGRKPRHLNSRHHLQRAPLTWRPWRSWRFSSRLPSPPPPPPLRLSLFASLSRFLR